MKSPNTAVTPSRYVLETVESMGLCTTAQDLQDWCSRNLRPGFARKARRLPITSAEDQWALFVLEHLPEVAAGVLAALSRGTKKDIVVLVSAGILWLVQAKKDYEKSHVGTVSFRAFAQEAIEYRLLREDEPIELRI